jgi:3-hydroxybutyryl-CoA dehydrogenase
MDLNSLKSISVIGSGLMGSGISQIFAGHGFKVTTYDVDPGQEQVMRDRISSNLSLIWAGEPDKDQRIKDLLDGIAFTIDLKSTAESADFVVECVPENLGLKQEIFSALDCMCREDVPLASNTSVMSITEIASKCKGKHRIIGTHFWNPPFLLPLVETVRTENTDDEIIELTMALLKKVGKRPILVKKDVPGFVANRLQHALWREAVSIVENDIADAQTVDEAIKYSFGLRLPVLAPLENADMVGTDLTLSIHEYVLPHLENSPDPSPYLKKLVENGDLGFKSDKGFMKWSKKEQQELQKKLINHLLKSVSNED